MKIHRETILSLPEPFYEVLERQLAALNHPSLNLVTLNYRDPDYNADSGGYHPVAINRYRQGDCWYLNDFTDVAYCGGPFPEQEKALEVLFQEQQVYNSFFGRCDLEHAASLVRLLLENFCNDVEMGCTRFKSAPTEVGAHKGILGTKQHRPHAGLRCAGAHIHHIAN